MLRNVAITRFLSDSSDVLNEVLSLNAQEYDLVISPDYVQDESSMKS